MFMPGLPAKVASSFRPVYLFLLNKWYFDELYDFLFVRPSMKIGRIFWKNGDGAIIDGFGPDGVSLVTRLAAVRAGKMQSGYVYHYAFVMMIGVVAIISWYMLTSGN
jgi:NADH-quinone oxidoreductase subunit L